MLQVLDIILIIIYCKRNSQFHTFRYPRPVFRYTSIFPPAINKISYTAL